MVTAADARRVDTLEKTLQELSQHQGKKEGDDRADHPPQYLEAKREYLSLLRKLRIRRSHVAAKYGLEILNDNASSRQLGSELWDLYEQVAVACMDCNRMETSKECIGTLMLRFPSSVRVSRLEGMWLESRGWFDHADRVYANALQDHPYDQGLHKRMVCMLKTQGRTLEAINSLTAYLEMYMSDTDAWRDLGELYISMSMYKQAAFCFEELLLSNPMNVLYNLTYAEILYTLGGAEDLRLAKAYFSAAVDYSDAKNMRALLGLRQCIVALSQAKGARAVTQKEDPKEGGSKEGLASVCSQLIERLYEQKGPVELARIVKGVVRGTKGGKD